MVATIFVAELTDKDAFLLIAVSTKVKTAVVFLAGATAFTITTALFVSFGSLLVAVVPVVWIRVAGGLVMVAYGLWMARGVIGLRTVEEEESRIERTETHLKAFLALVAALAFLDIAGDATEVLTIVFVSQYSELLLVFAGCLSGLLLATGVETTLGNRLGRVLTQRRLQYLSAGVFLALGTAILAFALL
jgi:putative Ca2+/H+ antiporter (TMEM165/GDT1 family)